MLKAIGSARNLETESEEFFSYIEDLLELPEVQQMKTYRHHGRATTFDHCINVAYYNYKLCKLLKLDAKAGARAGLLHDLFLYDWHTYKAPKGKPMHGFTHGEEACKNAEKVVDLTAKERDIITNHMFPMTLGTFPKHPETAVISLTDKYCGLLETVERPIHYRYKIKEKIRAMIG
jgi:uncharacterized protein